MSHIDKKKIFEFMKFFFILNFALVISSVVLIIICEPNHFVFGGVMGISLILSALFPELDISVFMWLLSAVLVIMGGIFLGLRMMGWIIYSSMASSFFVSIMEKIWLLKTPLTTDPLLELCFAVLLPSIGSALVFYIGASVGGTEILALILKKYTGLEVGRSLLVCDFGIVLMAAFVFGPTNGLYCILGFIARSVVIDNVIENLNSQKICTIVTEHPDSIRRFILEELHRTATEQIAKGAYTDSEKHVMMVALTKRQSVKLMEYIHKVDKGAFLTIVNSSEIRGNGFRAI